MKKKKFQKKLVLNKETIASLSEEEMHSAKGGGFLTDVIECYSLHGVWCYFTDIFWCGPPI